MTRTAAPLVLIGLVAAVLAGCSSADQPAPTRTPTPTSINNLDGVGVHLARAPFCDRLTDAAVRAALGATATTNDAWGNGDPVPEQGPGAGSSGQAGHEFGCSWTAGDGARAAAWVFARPVGAEFAATVVKSAAAESCPARPATTFGTPALLQTCTARFGLERVRRAGLFGDTWLTCEVTGPSDQVQARADRWCAAIVSALDVS
jgi:hypothetical protein